MIKRTIIEIIRIIREKIKQIRLRISTIDKNKNLKRKIIFRYFILVNIIMGIIALSFFNILKYYNISNYILEQYTK